MYEVVVDGLVGFKNWLWVDDLVGLNIEFMVGDIIWLNIWIIDGYVMCGIGDFIVRDILEYEAVTNDGNSVSGDVVLDMTGGVG